VKQITLVPVEKRLDVAGPPRSHLSRLRHRLPFLVVVVAPTLAAAIFYGLVAADRYEAASQFVIRSPSHTATSQLASLVQGSTIIRSSDDAFIVQAYLASRDIVRRLVDTADLRARLARPEADFLWRYPSPFLAHNEERLYKHMLNMASVDYDFSTGITTLKVQAFRPDDAKELAEAMLVSSEDFINRLSDRAQTDAISAAEREVEHARALAREAQAKVTAYRNKTGMIDPSRVSAAGLETLTRQALEGAQTSVQIAEIDKSSPQSAQIAILRRRKSALDDQIHQEQMRLAGSSVSLAPLIAEYERLVLERTFSERTFSSALSALEAARLDSERQKLFLERISNPSAPDYPQYPRRWFGVLAVLAVSSAIYWIGRMLLGDVREHRDM
jgi:capsular polysaccharide transport system permease protein